MSLAHYFDTAAATPLAQEAFAAMQPYLTDNYYNASALYGAARANRQAVEEARHIIAGSLGAKSTELIFTAGGSEANNIALRGVLDAHPGSTAVVSAIEHESVLKIADAYSIKIAPVTEKGIVSIEDLKTLITDKTAIVSVMYVNNEVGAIQPIRDIAQMVSVIKQERIKRGVSLPLYLHTDACQAANYLDMQVARLGVDLLTINSGKIYGPKQTGALYIRTGTKLSPLIFGGGQEHGLRSGTENIANICGFATAWQLVRSKHKHEALRLSTLRDKAIHQFEQRIPSIVINGPSHNKRIANNIHVTIPGCDNERLLMELDEAGFQVATGSACSASSELPSHVLKAMGISDELARSSIRITMGLHTTDTSLQKLIDYIVKTVAKA